MVEASLRATADPTCMPAVWLVGFEEAAPEQSGEICIAERDHLIRQAARARAAP
jgi:hypothetical protein